MKFRYVFSRNAHIPAVTIYILFDIRDEAFNCFCPNRTQFHDIPRFKHSRIPRKSDNYFFLSLMGFHPLDLSPLSVKEGSDRQLDKEIRQDLK